MAGAIGNALEWYDFVVYGFFAPIFAAQFFPSDDHLTSLIAAFGVFAVGFLLRPTGGILFGHIGDRYGRRWALTLSVVLMAVPTTLIVVLPTYGICARLNAGSLPARRFASSNNRWAYRGRDLKG